MPAINLLLDGPRILSIQFLKLLRKTKTLAHTRPSAAGQGSRANLPLSAQSDQMATTRPNEARTPALILFCSLSLFDSYFLLDLFLFKTLFIGLPFKSLS